MTCADDRREGAPDTIRRLSRSALASRVSAAAADTRCILFCAPAGYGKTDMLERLRDAPAPDDPVSIWLALRPGEGEPLRFAREVRDAWQAAFGDAAVPDAARGGGDPAAEAMIAALAGSAANAGRDVRFFIDDYDRVEGPETDRLVELLLDLAGPRLRLFMASRAEPGFARGERLRGRLLKIGREELAFSGEETRRLFEGVADDETARDIHAQTEGWPMAAAFVRERMKNMSAGAALERGLDDAARALCEDVYAGLDPQLQRFLLETSILETFDAALADEMRGTRDSERLLCGLAAADALLAPVDVGRGSYRRRRLFTRFLRARLRAEFSAGAIRALHSRAAAALGRRNDLLGAMDHAIEAGDEEALLKIFQARDIGAYWIVQDFRSFKRVMNRLERKFPAQAVRLAPIRAYYLIREGRFDEAEALLGAGSGGADGEAAGDALLVRVILDIYGDIETGQHVAGALRRDSREGQAYGPVRLGVLHGLAGLLDAREGRVASAGDAFNLAHSNFGRGNAPLGMIYADLFRGNVLMLKGEMEGALSAYGEAQDLYGRHAPREKVLGLPVRIYLAEWRYEAGDLPGAAATLAADRKELMATGDFWPDPIVKALHVEARSEFACGGLDGAFSVLAEGCAIAQRRNLPRLEKHMLALRLHFAVCAGEFALADKISAANAGLFPPVDRSSFPAIGWREDLRWALAAARLDIARRRVAPARQALARIRAAAAPMALPYYDLKIAALEALLAFVSGREQHASMQLRALVEAGEARQLRAFYVEEGGLARDLLGEAGRRFARSRSAGGFNETLVQWLVASSRFAPPEQRRSAPRLTKQQMAILALVVEGCDRTQIAERAQTTVYNVQYHLKKLFTIFGVKSSAQLIAEARRLDIFAQGAAPEDGEAGRFTGEQRA